MLAPDFEAVDENGAAWKLSDYRGKVVVVDFWGNW
jgi:peroxiredoxin